MSRTAASFRVALCTASVESEPFLHREFSADGSSRKLDIVGTVSGSQMTAVPEPGPALLLASGMLGVAMTRRLRA